MCVEWIVAPLVIFFFLGDLKLATLMIMGGALLTKCLRVSQEEQDSPINDGGRALRTSLLLQLLPLLLLHLKCRLLLLLAEMVRRHGELLISMNSSIASHNPSQNRVGFKNEGLGYKFSVFYHT